MPRKSNREKELEIKIKEWNEELKIYEDKETDVATVERNNLINLIENAKREIEEIHNKRKTDDTIIEDIPEQTLDEIEKEFEETEKALRKEEEERNVQKNVLKLRIERLKEEKEMYKADKTLFEEYEKSIKDAERELLDIEAKDTMDFSKKLEYKINEEKDKSIKKATALRIKKEKEIAKKKTEISKKHIEAQELLEKAGTKDAMTTKVLTDGTKVQIPKIQEVYAEIDKLQKEIRELEDDREKCQDFINKLKGIEKDIEKRELSAEEIRYFHGQGDLQERGENGSKDNTRANDEYFGLGESKVARRAKNVGDRTSGDTPKGDTPKGDTPKGDTPKGDTPKGDTPKGDTPKGDTPKGDTPKGDTPKGDTPKGDTPKENDNSEYLKALEEYKRLLDIYEDERIDLYDLHEKYENGEIDYAEYLEQANRIIEVYDITRAEYDKVKAMYDKEKKKLETDARNNATDKLQWHPDLTQEQIDYIRSELDIYEPVGQEYIQALEQLGLDPNKQPNLINSEPDLPQWHPDLTQEQIDWLISEKEIYEPVGQEYEQALKELGLDPNKKLKGKSDNTELDLEAPEEPQQPMLILEKEQKKEQEKESDKTFEEILYAVQAAKNSMSDAEVSRYEASEAKWLVPVKYDKGDWLRNAARFLVQGVLGTVVNAPRKIYSMIRTGKEQKEKMQNITENVDQLSDRDFEVLLKGLQSYKGHENKVSASLRKAVIARATRETNEQNRDRSEKIHEALIGIRESHERSIQIAEMLKDTSLSEDERQTLIEEKDELDKFGAEAVRFVEQARQEGALSQGGEGIHGLEEEDKAAREGSNLAGRKFSKRFSQNEELEKQQAELRKIQREARDNGDNFLEVDAFIEHEKVLELNSRTEKKVGITVSRSDRNHQSLVFSKEYVEDDLLRNVVTVATVAATTVNMIKQIQNSMALAQHNNDIQLANTANQQMAAKGENLRQTILNNEQTINDGIAGTDATRKAAAWGIGHTGAAVPYNYAGGWGSKNLDQMFHQIINGNVTDQTLKDFITNSSSAIRAYAQTHPQYDYTALLDSMSKLGNGGVDAIAQYNSAVRGVVQLAKNMGQISSTSVGLLSLSPTYIETMIPLVMTGKAITTKEYREALKKVKKKEKADSKKSFKESIKVRVKRRKENNTQDVGENEHTNDNERGDDSDASR